MKIRSILLFEQNSKKMARLLKCISQKTIANQTDQKHRLQCNWTQSSRRLWSGGLPRKLLFADKATPHSLKGNQKTAQWTRVTNSKSEFLFWRKEKVKTTIFFSGTEYICPHSICCFAVSRSKFSSKLVFASVDCTRKQFSLPLSFSIIIWPCLSANTVWVSFPSKMKAQFFLFSE